jgi:YcxB-like protein
VACGYNTISVQITYGISFDEFRTLQPAPRPHAGRTAFVLVMGLVCLSLIVPGAGLVVQAVADGQAPPAAALASIALGAALGAFAYLLDRRSLRRWHVRREQAIYAAYERVHCRDSRTLQATSESLSLTCKCGLVARPWSELTGFTETPSFLIPLTRNESFPIPKSAFSSEGELTEFRRLILDKLHTDRPFNACPIEFAHTHEDFWRAKWLHVRKGGGWRRVLKVAFAVALFLYAIAFTMNGARTGQLPSWLVLVVLGAFAFFLATTMRLRQHYFGPLRIYFSEEGFHVVDPASQSRRRWNELAGYLEDRHIYLLYLNPRLYRIVPKRALGHRLEEFGRLVQTALPPFDYRRRYPVANAARI